MQKIEITINRISFVSARPFDEIVVKLTSTIGRPDMNRFHQSIVEASVADLQYVVEQAVGPSNLMEFARYDAGEILRKGTNEKEPKILRLISGNPIIMKEMAKLVPDAAAYERVTMLVDERAEGVHLSYDMMASLLVPCGNETALNVARDLDTKIERMLESLM